MSAVRLCISLHFVIFTLGKWSDHRRWFSQYTASTG